MRNVPEKLTESHKPRALKPLGQNSDLRMCERLFAEAHTDAGGKDFLPSFNPDSLNVMTANVEPSLAGMQQDQKLQFEQHEYFVADRLDHVARAKPGDGLKDS